MDETVRVITELRLRREAQELDRRVLVAHLQLSCKDGGEGLDGRTIRDWEDRGHAPSPFYQAALCSYFGVGSVAELGLGETLRAAQHWTWGTPDERKGEVQRRRFCRLTAAAAGGALLPVAPLTAAAQMLGGRRRLGAVDVDTVRIAATHIASRYSITPNPETRAAAQAHAYTLDDLLKRASMTPGTRAWLAAIASDAASLAGLAHNGAGRFARADAWFARALRLAREAGDRRMEALALASHALTPKLAGLEPDHAAAVAAYEAAAELQMCLPAAARACLFGLLALERAALGDDLGSGRLLEVARDCCARVASDEPGWGMWSTHAELAGWDSVRIDAYTGMRSLRLGRPADAVGMLEPALVGTVRPVGRCYLHADLTRAWAALGDPDRASASAVAALDEAKTHDLELFRGQIRKARATFPRPWNRLAPVIELDERLSLAS
ncbi:MAG: hypothetical protein ACRD0K_25740 [Egibacteraceae bacterium]